jgi:archaellum component FlaG (FlaF/FlaG flagellin family)
MVSEGVTTAILVVAGVVVAAMVASTIISQYYIVDSTVRGANRGLEDRLKTRVEVVHGVFEGDHFIVFAKNTGRRAITVKEVESIDVYFGKNCETLYRLGSEPWTWSYEELNGDNIWSVGETLVLRIRNGTTIGPPPYCVKIVLPNGVTSEGVIVG